MKPEHAETVAQVFRDVLEKLAFMFVEQVEKEDVEKGPGNYVAAKMGFTRDLTGSLAMAVPAAMCPIIAANVLGLDEGEDQVMKEALDALKELLNVACGNILTAIAGESAIMDLSVPKVSKLNDESYQEFLEDPDTLAFETDDGTVLLQLHFDSPV